MPAYKPAKSASNDLVGQIYVQFLHQYNGAVHGENGKVQIVMELGHHEACCYLGWVRDVCLEYIPGSAQQGLISYVKDYGVGRRC